MNYLSHFYQTNKIQGLVFNLKTNFIQQEIEASRSLLLEELPPVLVLHLKRFIYNETSEEESLEIKKALLENLDLAKAYQGMLTVKDELEQ